VTDSRLLLGGVMEGSGQRFEMFARVGEYAVTFCIVWSTGALPDRTLAHGTLREREQLRRCGHCERKKNIFDIHPIMRDVLAHTS
jgi:hypothetical protein